MLIGFLTDVEGSLSFVQRFVESSRILRWTDHDRKDLTLQDPENHYFVFGGDLFDRGPWDCTLSRLFVNLKRRHPTRVFLLMGNRDINKLRLASELHPSEIQRPLSEIEVVPGVGGKTIESYLTERAAKEGCSVESLNTQANRLRYCYLHTLGCEQTFEFRRQELSLLGEHKHAITDEDIVQDVLDSIRPGGWVLEYLRVAQVGVVLGDTVFVHGAITQATVDVVPTLAVRYVDAHKDITKVPCYTLAAHDVRVWLNHLNTFASQALDEYCERPLWNPERTRRGGESLMAWQSSPASASQTPIVSGYMDRGELGTFSMSVVRFLQGSGIRRICVGHKPAGDCPLFLRVDKGIEVINADLTRTDPTSRDGRGDVAVGEVVIHFDENTHTSLTSVHGILPSGKRYAYRGDDPLVGQITDEGFFVRALLEGGESYWLTRTKNRVAEHKECGAQDIRAKCWLAVEGKL